MIEYLDWDSSFFQFKTGLINHREGVDLESMLVTARSSDFKLIYVFGNENFYTEESLLKKYGGKLIDRKVFFERNVTEDCVGNFEQTGLYDSQKVNPHLIQLAYESGKYSRFKLDANFAPHIFEQMYLQWISKSVEGKIANKVYVVKENSNPVSMVTLKFKNDTVHIGLIATLPKHQGKGYGKQLINRTLHTAKEHSMKKIEVSTQYENQQACLFYQNCGFKIKSISNIYHFWL